MQLDWSALECVEMTNWIVVPNKVFPYAVVIQGGRLRPNPDALNLAKRIMEHFDMFTKSATLHLRALVNPKIAEDGVEVDAFHFCEHGNAFEVYLILGGDPSARWTTRFVRRGGDSINNFSPCELARTEQ
ncbi:MAG: hypothetical protein ABIS50_01415 [Luteolibacter sp.]|uniref:hypothetical protein n=1 Tax=Luteolibacter sp. TaxID=1962973 RepID=UPI0032655FAB